jgi:predicted nucleic acid-binding protein
MIVYLDTSALVKRYVREAGTKEVNKLFEQANIVGSSIITRVEMASALAKAARMEWVEKDSVEKAWQDFLDQWLSFVRLSVTSTLVDRASNFAKVNGLRAYDATHFAAAFTWQEMLETPITLATYDRELWLAAKTASMSVWPEALP